MIPSERGSVATAVSMPPTTCSMVLSLKSKKVAPRKVHKAEREKLKRDHLNDLLVELEGS